MNFIKKNWYKFILLSYFFIIPVFSFAQGSIPPSSQSTGRIVNPIKVDTVQGVIKFFLEGALKLGIPVVALAIIYCGFLFVTAQGKPEEIGKAKDALLYTLIGAAVLIGAWSIANLISNTVTGLSLSFINITIS